MPIDISSDDFRKLGHKLVDDIAEFIENIHKLPVTKGELPTNLNQLVGSKTLPDKGVPVEDIIDKSTKLLFEHSLLNGHPKFLGYITSSAAPVGALADLLAASVNPNCGAQILSPIATEIEKQTIGWLAEFIGVPSNFDGVLVSGGNIANITGFLTGFINKAPAGLKKEGMSSVKGKMIVYCSRTTHTWVEKAATLTGVGSNNIRWIPTDSSNVMNNQKLKESIQSDIAQGSRPVMVVGTAGDVSTGAVDDLKGIAQICNDFGLWFHVDGAYGIPAAVIPELSPLFEGIAHADSIALDPHKWLYSPLEAGCTLVKDPLNLMRAFSSHPEYYNFGNDEIGVSKNYYEYGLQNSRGFRALKVWMALQQAGKSGYIKMIGDDIELSKYFYKLADEHKELIAVSQNLSITTLQYIPDGYDSNTQGSLDYLNELNEKLLNVLQKNGEVFLSNALVNDHYCLRGCIVNFRTTEKDIEEIIEIIVREGRKVHGNK